MKQGVNHASRGPVVLIIGTRPEGIKLVPLYLALKKAQIPTVICSTMQHDVLLTQVFDLFHIKPDFDLHIMRLGQDLFYVTQAVLQKTKELFTTIQPGVVVVQGDTTSSMAAALSAFYRGIPVIHVEAGLRTDDIYSPFPEEMNRRIIGSLATLHCAPTSLAVDNLRTEGVPAERIMLTGNTVVDALRIMKNKLYTQEIAVLPLFKSQIDECRKRFNTLVILTAHRRESFDGGLSRILHTVKQFLSQHPDVACIYPFHPNPVVIQAIADAQLSDLSNMILREPISYQEMVYLLLAADVVLTDSGGLQEEAVSLGKPVLVLREKTERMEGVFAGLAQIVGTDQEKLYKALVATCHREKENTNVIDVYGDGYAAEKITALIEQYYPSLHSEDIPLRIAGEKFQETKKNTTWSMQSNTQREKRMERVCMVGLGYIGLPTALVAADHGCQVIGVDIDQQRVESINAGDPVIHEPEIYEKLQHALGSGRFRATVAMEQADYFVVAVPTPFKENKLADLSFVYQAGEAIAPLLATGNVVILESTIPVGTTQAFAQFLEQKTQLRAGIDFYVAHCPERVLPGNIFKELVHNDRIIGGINQESVTAAKKLYNYFVQGNLYLTNAATAEMVKLVENSSRDVQIAFANQVASMAYSIGLNPFEVIELANKHPRVDILKPGCGVGGHCIAVDPWFLVETFPQHTQLLHAARIVNDNKPQEVIRCLEGVVHAWQENNNGARCKVAVFGLTYKPDVDDLRESPALHIANLIATWPHIDFMVVEPHVHQSKMVTLFGARVASMTDAIENAEVVLFLVGHTRFKALDKKQLAHKKILDFCGLLYEPKKQSDQKEHMFWPARSAMDFFAAQTAPNYHQASQASIQKETP